MLHSYSTQTTTVHVGWCFYDKLFKSHGHMFLGFLPALALVPTLRAGHTTEWDACTFKLHVTENVKHAGTTV